MEKISTLNENQSKQLKTSNGPRPDVIMALINFSKSYSVKNLKSFGQAEIVLN
jgi:hypothetical protein